MAEQPQFNACNEIKKVLRLTPKYISSTHFPTLLRQHLPKQFVDEEVFGVYNTACTFIKHMKYDKAELVEVEDVVKKPTRVRRLQDHHNESVRTVQNQLLLLRRVPEDCVENAQEDVQSADEGGGE